MATTRADDYIIQRREAEERALAEMPVVDRNGVPIEVDQVIRWRSEYWGTRVARVVGIRPSFAATPDGYVGAARRPLWDAVDTEAYRAGSDGYQGGLSKHGCYAPEAEVLTDPEEIARWEAEQIDIRIGNLDDQELRLQQKQREIRQERRRLLQEREARR